MQLREKVANMSTTLNELTSMVEKVNLIDEKTMKVKGSKKRRYETSSKMSSEKIQLESTNMMNDAVMSAVSDFDTELAFNPGSIFPSSELLSREETLSSLNTTAFVDDLMNAYDNDEMESLGFENVLCLSTPLPPIPQQTNSNPEIFFLKPAVVSEEHSPKANMKEAYNVFARTNLDPNLKEKLNKTLDLLPAQMQEMLVDKMVATIKRSDVFKNNVAKVTTSEQPLDFRVISPDMARTQTSCSISEENSNNSVNESDAKVPEADLQTAMRVLLTYMAKNNATKDNIVLNQIPSCVSVHA